MVATTPVIPAATVASDTIFRRLSAEAKSAMQHSTTIAIAPPDTRTARFSTELASHANKNPTIESSSMTTRGSECCTTGSPRIHPTAGWNVVSCVPTELPTASQETASSSEIIGASTRALPLDHRPRHTRMRALLALALAATAATAFEYSLLPIPIVTEFAGEAPFEFSCQGPATLSFVPTGSTATLSQAGTNCSLLSDVPGDYVVVDNVGVSTLRALDAAQSQLLWNDGFNGCPVIDTCSDAYDSVYVPAASVGSCAIERDGLFEVTMPGGGTDLVCGLATQRPALSFFGDSLVHSLRNISVAPSNPGWFAARFGLLPLSSEGDTVSWLLEAGPSDTGGASRRSLDSAAFGIGFDIQYFQGNSSPVAVLWTESNEKRVALSANCMKQGDGAWVDFVALQLDAKQASLMVTCGSTMGSVSLVHGIEWQVWGIGLGTVRAALVGVGANQGKVTFGSWQVDTLRPVGVLPGILTPTPDGAIVDSARVSLGSAQDALSVSMGIVDVTLAPFRADPSSSRDSTAALQRAIDWSRANGLVAYLPAGQYSISDTLQAVSYGRLSSNAIVDEQGVLQQGSVSCRSSPVVLRGAGNGSAVLTLATRAPGFGSPDSPKPVINMTYWKMASPGSPPHEQWNEAMNMALLSLGVHVLPGNPGAVGVRMRGAQGTTVEDVTIEMDSGLVGLAGLPGSGGSVTRLTVQGGQWAVDGRATQPQPTITALSTSGQACGAVLSWSEQTLVLVGANLSLSNPTVPAIAVGCDVSYPGGCASPPLLVGACDSGSAVNGQLTVIDSVIGGAGSLAIDTSRAVALSNVWVEDAAVLLRAISQPEAVGPPLNLTLSAPSAGEWTVVSLASVPVSVPSVRWSQAQTLNLTVDDVFATERGVLRRSLQPNVSMVPSRSAPPPDLLQQHITTFPSWDTGSSVVFAKEHGVVGDGVTDDSGAIQALLNAQQPGTVVVLGPGQFAVSRGLLVPPGVSLQGSSPDATRVVPANLSTAGCPSLLCVRASSDSPSTLSFLQLRVWQSEAQAVSGATIQASGGQAKATALAMRQAYGWTSPLCGTASRLPGGGSCPADQVSDSAFWLFQGSSSPSRMAVLSLHMEQSSFQGPNYRHVLVTGDSPVRFYHLNAEHAESDANVEVSGATAAIYGLKSEGHRTVLLVSSAADVMLAGFGGNACASKDPPTVLFQVNSVSSLLMNLVGMESRTTLADGPSPCDDPTSTAFLAVFNSTTKPLERPTRFFTG
jgi:hypothetical protein